jgi:hypothetical protein
VKVIGREVVRFGWDGVVRLLGVGIGVGKGL